MAKISVAYQYRELLSDHLSTLDGFIWIHNKTVAGQEYDLLAFEPDWILTKCSSADISNIEQIFRRRSTASTSDPALFNGGLAGYIGYDFSREQPRNKPANKPVTKKSNSQTALPPDVFIGYYPTNYLVIDHQNQTISGEVTDAAAFEALQQQWTKSSVKARLERTPAEFKDAFRLTSRFKQAWHWLQYQAAHRKIKNYLLQGDCYQVNLTQMLTAEYQGNPFVAFKRVLARHKTTHFAFVRTRSGDVLSFSPESFLSIEDGHICSKPIKGTRQRHPDPAKDRQIAENLLTSIKDRAENVMIVDLLRNDLGRIARTGSVQVKQLCQLESISNVHHLVSMICAELLDDISPFRALLACSPGGSITGAPKVRSMEIIDELEDFSRNIYCGSIFQYSHNGRLESNIAIRTVTCRDGKACIWGGGGIVADSIEAQEYEESLFKISHIIDVLSETIAD